MKPTNPEDPNLPVWLDDEARPVSCTEKVKVLNENYRELRQLAQDALEDGVLMGCSETQLRELFHELIDTLKTDYGSR
ncbi:MAG: hypothetical protein C0489_08175 [Candidatus Accumulibacter sp.]|nr:hypothetical protein [Accumulibacter sp.]MBA4094053.1 hypothetical protein [Accumulibacter sp.]